MAISAEFDWNDGHHPVLPDGPRPMVSLCALCPGAKEATRHLSGLGYRVSHSICDECKERVLASYPDDPGSPKTEKAGFEKEKAPDLNARRGASLR